MGNRVFPSRERKWKGNCPYRKRVELLSGDARERGIELWEKYRVACDLARGPDDKRADYWAWTAVARCDTLERFLKGRKV